MTRFKCNLRGIWCSKDWQLVSHLLLATRCPLQFGNPMANWFHDWVCWFFWFLRKGFLSSSSSTFSCRASISWFFLMRCPWKSKFGINTSQGWLRNKCGRRFEKAKKCCRAFFHIECSAWGTIPQFRILFGDQFYLTGFDFNQWIFILSMERRVFHWERWRF